jgi:hypothetical protein
MIVDAYAAIAQRCAELKVERDDPIAAYRAMLVRARQARQRAERAMSPMATPFAVTSCCAPWVIKPGSREPEHRQDEP